MTIQSLRGGVAILSLTALSVAMSAHAMLPTPTETPNLTSKQSDAGEVSYTANPQAKSNVSMTGKMAAVAPQSIFIQNPLGQSPTPTVTPMTVSPPKPPNKAHQQAFGAWLMRLSCKISTVKRRSRPSMLTLPSNQAIP